MGIFCTRTFVFIRTAPLIIDLFYQDYCLRPSLQQWTVNDHYNVIQTSQWQIAYKRYIKPTSGYVVTFNKNAMHFLHSQMFVTMHVQPVNDRLAGVH